MAKRTILVNPVGTVHDRNVSIFQEMLPEWSFRRLYNPAHAWVANGKALDSSGIYYKRGRLPKGVLAGVDGVLLFSSQPRIPACDLITEAALAGIPVIAVEEVYQMVLEQGYVCEYSLPVDRLFVGSDFEREKFVELGYAPEQVETTGSVLRRPREAPLAPDEKMARKRSLGLDPSRPVVTLSLAYLTPSGETPLIRKKLLEIAAKGVPEEYQLLVKPHPAETDAGLADIVKAYAPRALLIDRYLPIQTVLNATDLLVARGTSQVVLEALEHGLPVVLIPQGRLTFFHGILDKAIADGAKELRDACNLVRREGMSFYRPIFDRYLSIAPEESRRLVAERMKEIVDGRLCGPRNERITELALWWGFMGFNRHALGLLDRGSGASDLDRQALRLIGGNHSGETRVYFRTWGRAGFRKWLAQSLWIRALYLGRKRLEDVDTEWLSDFPPRMNRENYVAFACMLVWCHLRMNDKGRAAEVLSGIREEYGFRGDIRVLQKMHGSSAALTGLADAVEEARFKTKTMLKRIAFSHSY